MGPHPLLAYFMGTPLPRYAVRMVQRLPAAEVRAGTASHLLQSRAPAAFTRVATSLPGEVQILDAAYEEGTASAIALEAHEAVHQIQMDQDPGFLDLYARWEERTRALGLPPWQNPLEWPAYAKEAAVFHDALAQGLPPGSRLPLLVEEAQKRRR